MNRRHSSYRAPKAPSFAYEQPTPGYFSDTNERFWQNSDRGINDDRSRFDLLRHPQDTAQFIREVATHLQDLAHRLHMARRIPQATLQTLLNLYWKLWHYARDLRPDFLDGVRILDHTPPYVLVRAIRDVCRLLHGLSTEHDPRLPRLKERLAILVILKCVVDVMQAGEVNVAATGDVHDGQWMRSEVECFEKLECLIATCKSEPLPYEMSPELSTRRHGRMNETSSHREPTGMNEDLNRTPATQQDRRPAMNVSFQSTRSVFGERPGALRRSPGNQQPRVQPGSNTRSNPSFGNAVTGPSVLSATVSDADTENLQHAVANLTAEVSLLQLRMLELSRLHSQNKSSASTGTRTTSTHMADHEQRIAIDPETGSGDHDNISTAATPGTESTQTVEEGRISPTTSDDREAVTNHNQDTADAEDDVHGSDFPPHF